MNIFFLDRNPGVCAKYHTDKHVVKMILESAQLLSTAINVRSYGVLETTYKATHINHPCALWIRESLDNWMWLHDLMTELNAEYRYRYNKTQDHLSIRVLKADDIVNKAHMCLPAHIGFTKVALAIPDQYKHWDSAVACYRAYYVGEKQHLFKWTKRDKPDWIN